jgi:endonuclease-3
MNSAKRRAIFERFRAANPHPTTELEYQTPFELLSR